jgi:DNA-binding NarL/FixJ family response regulator
MLDPAIPAEHVAQPVVKKRVLIADSSDRDRMAIAEALRPHKARVEIIETETMDGALKALRQNKIDIAYVDLKLRDGSGVAAIGQARREGHEPFLVLTSGAVLPNWAMVATDVFAYEFLKKPCAADDIVNALLAFECMNRPTMVMLADPNEIARNIMRKIINASQFKCDIDETDNGHHAVKMARIRAYDLALIDSGLTGMSGLETACQLQSQFPDTAVALLLAASNKALASSLKHFSLQHTLSKPFFARDVDLLLHQVHGLRRPYLMNATIKTDKQAMSA